MNVFLLGHAPAKGALRAIAQALRDQQAGVISCYFDGDLAALSQRSDSFRSVDAVIFGLSPMSRNKDTPEYDIERELMIRAAHSGAAFFLVPDDTDSINLPHLENIDGYVTGFVAYHEDGGHDRDKLNICTYAIRVPNPIEGAHKIAYMVSEIARSPGHFLTIW